jgi:hypothetical protein
MNKHKSTTENSSLAQTEVSPGHALAIHKTDPVSIGRLLVLVPPELDYGAATRRIWELAVATGRRIQFLSLCKDKVQEASLHIQLIMMSALMEDSGVATEAKVAIGTNWVQTVKQNYQTGDIIVCFAEQRDGFLRKPLNQILEENLDVPIVIYSGLYQQHRSRLNLLSRTLLWAGVISIITGAFFLQIQITALLRGWEQTTILIFSVLAEFSLIWAWSHLFS